MAEMYREVRCKILQTICSSIETEQFYINVSAFQLQGQHMTSVTSIFLLAQNEFYHEIKTHCLITGVSSPLKPFGVRSNVGVMLYLQWKL